MSVCSLDERLLSKASLIINYSLFFALVLPEAKINIFQIKGIQEIFLFDLHVSQLLRTTHYGCLYTACLLDLSNKKNLWC